MKYIAQSFEEFLSESFSAPSASLANTPGMGNVAALDDSGAEDIGNFSTSSGDQDGLRKFHSDLVIEDDGTDGWMRPNGNYQKRGWIAHNFSQYMNLHQSNARFQIGESVVCVDPDMGCFGQLCRIVAFEDNTIRVEVYNSETGVGQTAKQFRCYASCLKKI
jgi:hypothetical protein